MKWYPPAILIPRNVEALVSASNGAWSEYLDIDPNMDRDVFNDTIWDLYRTMKFVPWIIHDYYALHKPERADDKSWLIDVTVNELGAACIEALKRGWCWNFFTKAIDKPQTHIWYDQILSHGTYPDHLSDIILSLEDDELVQYKELAIYNKLARM